MMATDDMFFVGPKNIHALTPPRDETINVESSSVSTPVLSSPISWDDEMKAAMVHPPVTVSIPLYEWEISSESRVTYDDLHQRILHQRDDTLWVIDCMKTGVARDGLCYPFPQALCDTIRFAPNTNFLAYSIHRLKNVAIVGVSPYSENIEEIGVPLKSNTKSVILDIFWLTSSSDEQAELVVLTTQGIEFFKFLYSSLSVKLIKRIPLSTTSAWFESLSGYVVVSTSSKILQPFHMNVKNPIKLPKIELTLPRWQIIQQNDVSVVTIYEQTYCIHKDTSVGRISLRCLSHPSQPDFVLNVLTPGPLSLNLLDNIIVVHHHRREITYLFDLHQPETLKDSTMYYSSKEETNEEWQPLMSPHLLCNPLRLKSVQRQDEPSSTYYSYDKQFLFSNILMNERMGILYTLDLHMDSLMYTILQEQKDVAWVSQVLLRRRNARICLISILKKALIYQWPLDAIFTTFHLINEAYRRIIEHLTQSPSSGGSKLPRITIKYSKFLDVVGSKTILSENEMVMDVFYPHIVQELQISKDADILDYCLKRRMEFMQETSISKANETSLSCVSSSSFFLTCILEYVRNLLQFQILPHKSLQLLVFDACIAYNSDNLLQQLLQYHAIMDSPEIIRRLYSLWKCMHYPWAKQTCLDMAFRLNQWTVVVDILIACKQYLDVIPLLKKYPTNYPLYTFLHSAASDVAAQTIDTSLLPNLLAAISSWIKDYKMNPSKIPMPNIQECDLWLPSVSLHDDLSSQPLLSLSSKDIHDTTSLEETDAKSDE